MSFFCVLLVCCALVLFVSAAPVLQESQLIGVDMGTSFLKVAAFRRYTEFIEKELGWTVNNNNVEMVLNDQTNRKSPPCVAFRYFPSAVKKSENVGADKNVTLVPEGYTLERSFAEQAQVLQPRVPLNVVCSPTSLLLSQDGEETRIPFP
ncbi:hypothetical protein ADEAN_000874300 [Angomonas deanei]|uniref:Uncharacterized protein n=1 Tax=Angomonas deanei TaxID=59799 RepID=A0A7G2CSM2_9TRYP|nr:hypothetical protein ADEAN_000874300 [Angomonas deanei]